jgi:hypothetical protein
MRALCQFKSLDGRGVAPRQCFLVFPHDSSSSEATAAASSGEEAERGWARASGAVAVNRRGRLDCWRRGGCDQRRRAPTRFLFVAAKTRNRIERACGGADGGVRPGGAVAVNRRRGGMRQWRMGPWSRI